MKTEQNKQEREKEMKFSKIKAKRTDTGNVAQLTLPIDIETLKDRKAIIEKVWSDDMWEEKRTENNAESVRLIVWQILESGPKEIVNIYEHSYSHFNHFVKFAEEFNQACQAAA